MDIHVQYSHVRVVIHMHLIGTGDVSKRVFGALEVPVLKSLCTNSLIVIRIKCLRLRYTVLYSRLKNSTSTLNY